MESLTYSDLIQPVTFPLLTIVGWGVKAIWGKVCAFDNKIDAIRREMHEELKEYARKEECKAHREAIQHKIDAMSKIHGYCMTQNGLALVDINNVSQMSELYNLLTPEQRKKHAEQCQFKDEMS